MVLSIDQAISEVTGNDFVTDNRRSVSGGSINSAAVVSCASEQYFVKTNSLEFGDMFSAEFEGLIALQQVNAIRVPQAICFGKTSNESFLVLEYVEFSSGNINSSAGVSAAAMLGTQLADLHRKSSLANATKPSLRFGWHRDNTIGSTSQVNQYEFDWIVFYQTHRLAFQLTLANQNNYSSKLQVLGDKLLTDLPHFFQNYHVTPSLLHGDLWSGNYAYDENKTPIIFDPAVYFGDREVDIAMTELFGGFSTDFYQAYHESYALNDGYAVRKTLYNLYHILNHLNLFGSGYQSQAIDMMQQLLSEL